MFCFQCEQTAGCTGCTRAGVCGKSAMTAKLQDTLTGALIALANTAACSNKNSNNNLTAVLMDEINHLILEGLFTTITNVNFDDASIKDLTARIHTAAAKTANACNVSIVSDYDMNNIWNANEGHSLLKVSDSVWCARYGSLRIPCNDTRLHRCFLKPVFLNCTRFSV